MKEPEHDDERLSALLAGRLEGPERDELLAYLSTADEDSDVFADTAAILREMEEEDAQAEAPGVPPKTPEPRREAVPPSVTKSTRGWPRKTPRWAVIPVLVGLVVLGFVASRARGARAADPVQVAALLADAGQGLPEAWRPAWTPSRGDPAPAKAAEAGASLVWLAVAIQAGDSLGTDTLAFEVRENFDRQGGSVLREIQARAGAPAESLRPLLERATARLEDMHGRDYLRLGAWAEAARLATSRRDAGLFRTGETRAALRLAGRLTREDPGARAAVAGIRAAIAGDGEPDWAPLETRLDALFREIAR